MSEMNYEALDEALDYIEAVNEGANTDLLAKTSQFRKDYKALYKKLNKTWDDNEGDKKYSESKKVVKEMYDLISEYEKFIKDLDFSTVSEKVIGNLLGVLYFFSQHLYSGIFLIIGVASKAIGKKLNSADLDEYGKGVMIGAGAGQSIKNLLHLINDIDTYKKHFGDSDKKDVNAIKIKLLTYAKQVKSNTVEIENSIDYQQKMDK